MKTKETSSRPWYKRRTGALAMAAIAVLPLYPLGLRAIDTGSLQQYGLIFILLAFIGAMVVRVMRVTITVGWRRQSRQGKKDHGKK